MFLFPPGHTTFFICFFLFLREVWVNMLGPPLVGILYVLKKNEDEYGSLLFHYFCYSSYVLFLNIDKEMGKELKFKRVSEEFVLYSSHSHFLLILFLSSLTLMVLLTKISLHIINKKLHFWNKSKLSQLHILDHF